MVISDVRIRLINKDDNKLKAVASVTLDNCFVIHDIRIIESSDELFIAMPSRKTNEGEYKDIAHPLNSETRETFKKTIISAYQAELNK